MAAEHLDEALVEASRALDAGHDTFLDDRYGNARLACEEGWVRYSPRIHEANVLARYESVGSIRAEVARGDRTAREVRRHVVGRAIASARATLGYFLRGEPLPAAAFPEPEELRNLLRRGEGTEEPMRPLREWLNQRPYPTSTLAP